MSFWAKLGTLLGILAVFFFINYKVAGMGYDVILPTVDYRDTPFDITMNRDDVVEVTDIREGKRGTTVIELKAIGKGEVELCFHSENPNLDGVIYSYTVTSSGIIYEKGIIGSIGNMKILRYEIAFLYLLVFVNLMISIRKHTRKNPYSYRIMYYLGGAVFSGFNALFWLVGSVFDPFIWSQRLSSVFADLINAPITFCIIMIPAVLILAVGLTVSNIVLLIKEGFRVRNMLGIGLGIFLIFLTAFGLAIYPVFYTVSELDNNLSIHVELFIELLVFSFLAYFECMLIGTLIGTVAAHRYVPKFEQDYVIILGSGLRKDGTVTPLLKNRADRAVWFAGKQKEKTGKEIIFVPSGGQGADEVVSESRAITNYLLECNIPEEKILMEDKSKSTYENMKFSKEVIENHSGASASDLHIAFSTTDYHVFRSGRFARKLGMNAFGMGAPTKWYFYVNALIREFVANVKVQSRRHIGNLILLVMVFAGALIFSYIFNIM